MEYKRYGALIKVSSKIPHHFSKLNDEIHLTEDGVITKNEFLANFGWDCSIRDSATEEIQVKTKYEVDKVFLITSDRWWGFAYLQPKGKPNPNNLLLGD